MEMFNEIFYFLNYVIKDLWNRTSPHYAAGGISKQSFISTATPAIHTNPSRKRSFSKTHFKPEEFENTDFLYLR